MIDSLPAFQLKMVCRIGSLEDGMEEELLIRGNAMSSDAYREVLEKLQQLTRKEKLKLIEEIVTGLRQEIEEPPLHDIMEYEGFAKAVWEGIDVAKYLNEERDSWGR
ncbi:MAG TPA: hypothetical protein VGN34_16580 [Ktedonobacteraceae bacterium]|jgi:hypothetical protein